MNISRHDIARIIDANLNRAREGSRVLEEIARFVYNDSDLAMKVKTLRHSIVQNCMSFGFDRANLLSARDSETDVGRTIQGSLESERASINDLTASNFARVQEALRSIEEFGKFVNPKVVQNIKDLRYDTYSLEKNFMLVSELKSGEM